MNSTTIQPPYSSPKTKLIEPYLRVKLNPQTSAVLPMQYAQGVTILPKTRITPMPNMPNGVLGLLNQRSRILWVVDISKMLEIETFKNEPKEYAIVIIQVEKNSLALVVQEIKGVMHLEVNLINPPIGVVSPNLTPYLWGYIWQEKEITLVLDIESIINSPLLKSNF